MVFQSSSFPARFPAPLSLSSYFFDFFQLLFNSRLGGGGVEGVTPPIAFPLFKYNFYQTH